MSVRYVTMGPARRFSSVISPQLVQEMNSPHLSSGSTCPNLDRSKVIFFNMRFCPYAHRTALVLLAKQIPFQVVNVNLKRKPDWFLAKNPLGKVPVIELLDEAAVISESLVTCDYLDEKFPKDRLLPVNLERKARDKQFIQFSTKISVPMHKSLLASTNEDRRLAFDRMLEGIRLFESELESRKSDFFYGSKPGMLDYMIWPWFERLGVYADMPGHLFPVMEKWISRMKEDPAVKACAISKEDHGRFLTSLASGTPMYDLLSKL